MRDFREPKVWRKSHRLTPDVYKATARFPQEELYGLMSQAGRAAVSIPANIAEGCGRSGNAELARFMLISISSTSKLEYHLLPARDLGYLNDSEYEQLAGKIGRGKTHASPIHK